MSAILLIAKNTLRQTVRQKLFYNIAIFGVGMLLLAMVMGRVTFGHPDRVVRSIGLSGVSLALNVIALLLSVSLIHQEIEQKTVFVVLTRPLQRWHYVFGRYLGLLYALSLALLGLSLVFVATLYAAGGRFGESDVLVLLAALPEAAMLGGVGLILSAFSTPTLSAGLALGVWVISASIDDLLRLTVGADSATRVLVQTAHTVLPALARLNFREEAIYGIAVQSSEYWGAMLYSGIYIAALVALASLIFTRREMV